MIKACSIALNSRRLTPPAAALALAVRGAALVDIGQRHAGLTDLDAAIQLKPDLALARVMRARLLFGDREHDRELADWNEVIRIDPSSIQALRQRGNTLDYIGRHDEAIADYTAALRLKSDALIYTDRAIAYANKGDDKHALADFGEAINLDANSSEAYTGRGRLHFARGHFPAAVADFQAAVRLKPTDHYAVLWLYLAHARAGENGTSELARQATKLNLDAWPGPVALLFLGQLPPDKVKPHPDPVPLQEIGNLCEAQFYKAEYYLIHGDRARAATAFQAAVDTGTVEFVEYHQARIELSALGH